MIRLKTQIWVWMTALIFRLFIVLLAYNFYTIKILNNQIAANSKDTLSIYEKPVIKDINYTSYSMANELENNSTILFAVKASNCQDSPHPMKYGVTRSINSCTIGICSNFRCLHHKAEKLYTR